MAVINTNYLSLVAQGNLNKSQSALGTAIERLSSGLRINSAKDDAAGQAIANRMTAQIRGMNQASRNANDGISMAQTTEGSLNEMNNNLQRIRELAVQATTGTNTPSDLASIQGEIKQRLAEIDRVSQQTTFNGINVLSKDQTLKLQVGANDGETIDLKLSKMDTATMGLDSFNVSGPNGTTGALVAADYQAAYGSTTNVTTNAVTEKTADTLSTRLGLAAGGAVLGGTLVKDSDGNWFATVAIKATTAQEQTNLANNGIDMGTTALGTAKTFYIAVDPQQADTTTTAGTAAYNIDTSTTDLTALSQGRTGSPMSALDTAEKKLDDLRSSLGAIQNRLESTVANLGNSVTNLSAAQSRIQDADYATEVSAMTRAQILQQAGTAVLAQANQVPQTVLSLLK